MSPGDLVTSVDRSSGTPLFDDSFSPGVYCAQIMRVGEIALLLERLMGEEMSMVRVLYQGQVFSTYECSLEPLERAS